jgi:hypothetical protein
MTTAPACVYTALIGGYERLNEQPTAASSSLPYICYTDDPTLRSDSWEIRLVEPLFQSDPVRSQREIKLRAHNHVGEFASSLYIDNSVVLTAAPDAWLTQQLATHAMAVPTHSFRDTVRDELLEVLGAGLDDPTRFEEQLEYYEASFPEALAERPYWNGMLFRRHQDETVRRTMELWFQHVLRYSRRDQLSLNVALRQTGLAIARIEMDNHASAYHRWPVKLDRLPSRAHPRASQLRARALEHEATVAKVATLEAEVAALVAAGELLRSAAAEARHQAAAAQREADDARQELAESQADLAATRSTAAAAARELAEVRSSASWKLGHGLVRILRQVRPRRLPRR